MCYFGLLCNLFANFQANTYFGFISNELICIIISFLSNTCSCICSIFFNYLYPLTIYIFNPWDINYLYFGFILFATPKNNTLIEREKKHRNVLIRIKLSRKIWLFMLQMTIISPNLCLHRRLLAQKTIWTKLFAIFSTNMPRKRILFMLQMTTISPNWCLYHPFFTHKNSYKSSD